MVDFISNQKEKLPELKNQPRVARKIDPSGAMEILPLSDNIFVIDYLDLKTEKSEQMGIHFMKALKTAFKENGVNLGNPWQHKIQYKRSYLELDKPPHCSPRPRWPKLQASRYCAWR